MNVAVNSMTAPSGLRVGRTRHTRNPYSSVRLTQMKWKGTVSHSENTSIATRFAALKPAQATSIHWRPPNSRRRSGRDDTVPLTPDRLDSPGTELAPQPPHVHVHDVRTTFEVVAPHHRQQPFLRDGLPRVRHEVAEEQELALGQRDGAGSGICLPPDQVEPQPAGREHGGTGLLGPTEPGPDPCHQLLQRERLGQVVL